MGKKSCFNNVLEQPILTRISNIGPTDDELEDNICINNLYVIGEGVKLLKNKIKINISGILCDH